MSYKIIHETFWTDPKVRRLSEKGKLLLLYLITNPHSHYSGIYYLPISLISEETGLPRRIIEQGLRILGDASLILRDGTSNVVWIRNMAKHQMTQGNPTNVVKGINNHLATLHNSPLIKHFVEAYTCLGVTMPEGYPKDSPSMPESVSEEEEVSGEEEREEKDGSSFPSPGENGLTDLSSLWNETCTSLSKVREVSEERKRKERKRLGERPLKEWQGVFNKIQSSSFCLGKNERGWKASYDWIMKGSDNAIKVLEGKYDEETAKYVSPLEKPKYGKYF